MKRRTLLAAAIAAMLPKPPAPVLAAANVTSPLAGYIGTYEGFRFVVSDYRVLAHPEQVSALGGDAS